MIVASGARDVLVSEDGAPDEQQGFAEQDLSAAQPELAPGPQLVITASWLTMKEAALLTGTLARALPLPSGSRPALCA